MTQPRLNQEEVKIVEARHHDPFAVLGRHPTKDGIVVCAYIPHAMEVAIAEGDLHLERVGQTDFFKWRGPADRVPERYRLIWRDDAHHQHIAYDPYCYPPQISDTDLYLFSEGKLRQAYKILGANERDVDGVRRRAVRRVGAERGARQRRRRFQSLGRPAPPLAGASWLWRLGIVRARPEPWCPLPIRDQKSAHRRDSAQVRSLRPAVRGATQDGIDRGRRAATRLAGRGVAGAPGELGLAALADVGVRGPPGVVAAGTRRRVSELSRARGTTRRLRQGHGFHPHRTDARHGASFRPVLGLPGDGLFRGDEPLRDVRTISAIWSITVIATGSASSWTGCPAHFPKDAYALARFDGTPCTSTRTRARASTSTGRR